MAYTLIEQQSRDLDIFLRDKGKIIHIASAGGRLPNILANSDLTSEDFFERLDSYEPIFEVEINGNIGELLGIQEAGLDNYLEDFRLMARRGFYSYDKTRIGNFDDRFFHLVAYPKFGDTKFIYREDDLIISNKNFPTDFKSFDLFNLFEG